MVFLERFFPSKTPPPLSLPSAYKWTPPESIRGDGPSSSVFPSPGIFSLFALPPSYGRLIPCAAGVCTTTPSNGKPTSFI